MVRHTLLPSGRDPNDAHSVLRHWQGRRFDEGRRRRRGAERSREGASVLAKLRTRRHRYRAQLALEFLDKFEKTYVNQGSHEKREINDSLDLAWNLLRIFPREQLNRISPKILDECV